MRLGQVVAGLVVLALSIGCSSHSVSGRTPIEQRVTEKWDAMVAGDYQAAYAYFTPGYRGKVSESAFSNRNALTDWLAYKVEDVICEDDICDVALKLDFNFNVLSYGPQKSTQRSREKWLWTDDNWYHLPEK